MATLRWTPADGFTRKTKPVIVKPTVAEKPKPPPVQPKPSSRKPSERQRAYWLKQNQLSPQEYTVADQYLVKQARTHTPMVFIGYGVIYSCTITWLWRYDLDLILDGVSTGSTRRIHKLDLALYYKVQDKEAVEKRLAFDADSVRDRPSQKLSERDGVDLSAVERGLKLTLTLRTGHRLTGVVRWVTDYDVGLTLPNGAKVHVFKHAISSCQPRC
jgi:sRNA-binding regulator protein Hfq